MSKRNDQVRKPKTKNTKGKKQPVKPSNGNVTRLPAEVKASQEYSAKRGKQMVAGALRPRVDKKGLEKATAAAKFSFGTNEDQVLKIGSNVLNIKGTMQVDTLRLALMTYLSTLYQYNAVGSYTNSIGDTSTVAWTQIAEGVAWLGQGMVSLSTGATAEVTKIPRIFDVMTQMLTEKTVRLGEGVVKYSPIWSADFDFPYAYTTPTGATWTCVAPDTGGSVMMPTNPVAPSPDAYSVLLKVSEQSKNFGMQIVTYGENKGLYSIDPSCYARLYPYFGSGGASKIACYNEVELEAPFQYPQFARFVEYDTDDKVIARLFHPSAGGISTSVGQTLVQDCNYSLLRNPIPAVYKFIDFYQVYTVLCSYAVNLLEQSFVANLAPGYTPASFSFTAEDFCGALRQAILTQFTSQVHAQFVAPQATVPQQNVSVFQPFIVDSLTAPSQAFSNFLLPLFLHENLNMLKSCSADVVQTPNSAKYKNTPKKLRSNFYPVWGVYSGDTIPQFNFFYDGTAYPLFAPSPPAPEFRLWDGVSGSNPNVKWNLNSSTFTAIATEWNDFMTRNQNHSSKITPISGDGGAGVSLLMYTRVLETIPQTFNGTAAEPKYRSPLYANITNKPKGEVKEVKEDKLKKKTAKVDAVPPASYFELFAQSILGHKQMAMDYFGVVRYFILPEIRLDSTGVDPITQAAYAVYTGEVCSVSNSMGTTPADNEIARLSIIGQLMTSGMFAADANNNILTSTMDTLAKEGKANDLIKSILGGMASLIPGVGGVISNVIQGL